MREARTTDEMPVHHIYHEYVKTEQICFVKPKFKSYTVVGARKFISKHVFLAKEILNGKSTFCKNFQPSRKPFVHILFKNGCRKSWRTDTRVNGGEN